MLHDLEREEKELCIRLINVRKKIMVEKLRLVKEKYGISVGSTVFDIKGKEHKVADIDVSILYGKPWVKGNPKLKNGTFGIATRNLYSEWKAVTE